ncbi:hypothetical protein P3X46_029457 [Hevea brasiliensis]|uniref:Bet v I/Major latex protein domain-containing protein n=1 Tax=Hevea brasiliensis TaxID=3981 RepID=A0ABQ9KS83_HEVBR|nr:hypothetical protein P3X46_029457 [Hevea brasiliensis]
MPRFLHMFQSNIKSFEVVGGGEVKTGSILRWKYCLEGSPVMEANLKLEALDDARNIIMFDVVEGDALKLYKRFKGKPEIEKANNDTPNPDGYLDLTAKVSKGMDAHLCK